MNKIKEFLYRAFMPYRYKLRNTYPKCYEVEICESCKHKGTKLCRDCDDFDKYKFKGDNLIA
jgi:hypothetical protein